MRPKFLQKINKTCKNHQKPHPSPPHSSDHPTAPLTGAVRLGPAPPPATPVSCEVESVSCVGSGGDRCVRRIGKGRRVREADATGEFAGPLGLERVVGSGRGDATRRAARDRGGWNASRVGWEGKTQARRKALREAATRSKFWGGVMRPEAFATLPGPTPVEVSMSIASIRGEEGGVPKPPDLDGPGIGVRSRSCMVRNRIGR